MTTRSGALALGQRRQDVATGWFRRRAPPARRQARGARRAGAPGRSPPRRRNRRRGGRRGRGWPSSCSSSVDLPMPGSPPISIAEPGTMPPPVTRSSSAMPVEKRGASSVEPFRPSSATTRPFVCRVMPEPGGGPASVSSTSVFHSPQAGHLPAQRGAVAPQFWQTKVFLFGLAMRGGYHREGA